MPARKVLIMGLPGAGKTTLATALAPMLRAVWWNADEVRASLGDPGFSQEARMAQARRMGWLCDVTNRAGHTAIADFVCPTEATRDAFDPDDRAIVVWVDRIKAGRFEDTNRLFVPPARVDYHLQGDGVSALVWAGLVCRDLQGR